MVRATKSIPAILAGGLALILASCGGPVEDPALKLHAVAGKVFYRDKPAVGATVSFVPQSADSKAIRPTGTVAADGTFRLTSRVTHDGAPAGTYAVTIVYPGPGVNGAEGDPGTDILQGRYGDPKKTPLKVEIKAEVNELEPFKLK